MIPTMTARPGHSKRLQGPTLILRRLGDGRTVPIGKSPVTIGRHPACEVALPEGAVPHS